MNDKYSFLTEYQSRFVDKKGYDKHIEQSLKALKDGSFSEIMTERYKKKYGNYHPDIARIYEVGVAESTNRILDIINIRKYTSLEDPMVILALENIHALIEPAIGVLSKDMEFRNSDYISDIDSTLFGSVHCEVFNGLAAVSPYEDGYLVLLNHGLLSLLDDLSKVYVRLFLMSESETSSINEAPNPIDEFGSIVSGRIRRDGNLKRYIESILESYFKGIECNTKEIDLDFKERTLSVALMHGAQYFVLAHEYGHILSSHFKQEEKIYGALGDNVWFRTPKEMEVEADFIGLLLLIVSSHMEHDNNPSKFLGEYFEQGPVFFLCCAILIENLGQSIGLDYFANDSHPSPFQRISNIRKWMKKYRNEDYDDMAFSITRITEMIIQSIEIKNLCITN